MADMVTSDCDECGSDERDTSDVGDGYMSSTDLFDDDQTQIEMANEPRTSTPAKRSSTLRRRLFSNPDEQNREPLRNVSNLSNAIEANTQRLILEELKKTNSRLDTFSERLEAFDGRLKSVEHNLINSTTPSSSSSDSSASKSKRKVPAKVAVSFK